MKGMFFGLLAILSLGCSYSYSLSEPVGAFVITGDPVQPELPEGALVDITIDKDALPSVDLDRTQGVFVDQLTLAVEAGSFDFLSEARVFAISEGAPSLPRVLIAEGSPAPGAPGLSLPGLPVDLRDYLEAGMSIEIEMTGTTPTEDVVVSGLVHIVVELL
jgi:hypothetical protein